MAVLDDVENLAVRYDPSARDIGASNERYRVQLDQRAGSGVSVT